MSLYNSIKRFVTARSYPPVVYLDHAAATPLCGEARAAMHAVEQHVGNPGSQHSFGRAARAMYEDARSRIAKVLAVKPQNIIVTASATEANNLALLGTLRYHAQTMRPHVITTAIEHSSVLEVLRSKEVSTVADVTILPVDQYGQLHADALRAALRPSTRLVSIGWANGEVGTIQPLRALVRVIREYEESHAIQIVVHTDAGQIGFAHSMQPQGVDIDLMTLGSGKLYGPRGVAVLYKKHSIDLHPILYGGHQEQGLRPGTEDVVPLAGFAAALERLEAHRKIEYAKIRDLTAVFLQFLKEKVPHAVVNGGVGGGAKDALPHIVNISVPGIDSEYVMFALDHTGVAISTKSVCVESTGEPVSHVVAALCAVHAPAKDAWRASTTLRFSLGKDTTLEDVHYAATSLQEVITTSSVVDK